MPELPEVETVVRTLRPHLLGAEVKEVWHSGFALRLGKAVDIKALRRFAKGGQIKAVRRVAKYVLCDVQGPAGVATTLIHLGMSGRLRVHKRNDERVPHTHVVWQLDGDRELRYSDPRRFGMVKAAQDDGFAELQHLGPDPLSELTVEHLAQALASCRTPLKSFLLDQKRIAGLGNIYVCEAMFYAGLHPNMPAHKAQKHAPLLFESIVRSLKTALDNRGTTLRDFVNSDGEFGTHQDALEVYGRQGGACHVCAGAIHRQTDSGRSTFYCPRCQRRGRPAKM